jgi:hypothetical protein
MRNDLLVAIATFSEPNPGLPVSKITVCYRPNIHASVNNLLTTPPIVEEECMEFRSLVRHLIYQAKVLSAILDVSSNATGLNGLPLNVVSCVLASTTWCCGHTTPARLLANWLAIATVASGAIVIGVCGEGVRGGIDWIAVTRFKYQRGLPPGQQTVHTSSGLLVPSCRPARRSMARHPSRLAASAERKTPMST